MDELITAITPAIATLANFFGTSVEFLQAHLMEYVMEYGQYCYAMNIASAISTCFTIGIVAWLFMAGCTFFCSMDEFETFKSWAKFNVKTDLILLAIIAIIMSACGLVWFFTTTYIPYHASPEIWSITKAMKLIKS